MNFDENRHGHDAIGSHQRHALINFLQSEIKTWQILDSWGQHQPANTCLINHSYRRIKSNHSNRFSLKSVTAFVNNKYSEQL
jgi:hypothetical protein